MGAITPPRLSPGFLPAFSRLSPGFPPAAQWNAGEFQKAKSGMDLKIRTARRLILIKSVVLPGAVCPGLNWCCNGLIYFLWHLKRAYTSPIIPLYAPIIMSVKSGRWPRTLIFRASWRRISKSIFALRSRSVRSFPNIGQISQDLAVSPLAVFIHEGSASKR